jgi:hypothetical protein
MIIALNGCRIQAGVDVGSSSSGKDTVANFLAEDHGFTIVSLADPMKRFAREVFDFSTDQLWGPNGVKNAPDKRYVTSSGTYLTPRRALQQLGVEWGRACCPMIWVEYAARTIRRLLHPPQAYDATYSPQLGVVLREGGFNLWPRIEDIVIPEVRFVNEAEGLRRLLGAVVVRILRPGAPVLTGELGSHSSETEQRLLSDSDFDFVVDNSSTLGDLRARTAEMLGLARKKVRDSAGS